MADTPSAHVLVVDDESGFRELAKRILEPAGYTVVTATNAHEALRSVRQSPPAVAICDIHMPGPTGLWLANQIRESSPHTALVLATSDATVPPMESMKRGVVAYILKPYRSRDVLEAVAQGYRWWSEQSGHEVPTLVAAPRPPAPPSAPFAAAAAVPATPAPAGRQRAGPARSSRRLLAIAASIIVVAAVLVLATIYLRRPRAEDVLSRVVNASGMVVVTDLAGRPVMQGSGFFVAPDAFVTNHHVVNNGPKATIVSASGEYRVAGVAAVDRARDLVLLKTTTPSAQHLPLAAAEPNVGDQISVYGAPLGLAGTLTTGIVSAVRNDAGRRLQITAPISPGSSGSPVVDASGGVVGVAVSSNSLGQALNFAIPARYVEELLEARGEVQPLLAASRGAGDDRERHGLIGPVHVVTLFSKEPLLETLERLTKEYRRTMPAAKAQQRAQEEALLSSRTRLFFDRNGRLTERQAGDGSVIKDSEAPGAVQSEPSVAREDRDAMGNPTRRVYADGSVAEFTYRMDARGNWVSREVARRDAKTGHTSVNNERRDIEYWD